MTNNLISLPDELYIHFIPRISKHAYKLNKFKEDLTE